MRHAQGCAEVQGRHYMSLKENGIYHTILCKCNAKASRYPSVLCHCCTGPMGGMQYTAATRLQYRTSTHAHTFGGQQRTKLEGRRARRGLACVPARGRQCRRGAGAVRGGRRPPPGGAAACMQPHRSGWCQLVAVGRGPWRRPTRTSVVRRVRWRANQKAGRQAGGGRVREPLLPRQPYPKP